MVSRHSGSPCSWLPAKVTDRLKVPELSRSGGQVVGVEINQKESKGKNKSRE